MSREKFTSAQVIAALQSQRGMVYLAARVLQCDPKTIYNMIKRHPEIGEVRDQQRGQMIDVAESALYKLIVNGNVPSIIFFLKTQARDRGYVERTQQTGVSLNLSTEDLAKLSDEELNALIVKLDAADGGA